ncbi:MAG TPA: hypothetical protein VIG62_09035 [Blastocatellia bacterium]|jgi:hypothetical protein
MDRLREKLNPEEEQNALTVPTRYMTDRNLHQLHCRECGEIYYLDDSIYRKVMAAIDWDSSENPFVCDECEEEYAEEEYS